MIISQIDQDSVAMSQTNPQSQNQKKVKTKEELAELRKQMMKKRKTAGSVQQMENAFENYPGGNLHTENNIYGQQLITL